MAGIVVVRDVMSKAVKVVRPDTSMKEVVVTMNKFSIGSIIVVQAERRPHVGQRMRESRVVDTSPSEPA